MNPLNEILSVGEAADIWGKSPVTIKHLCTGIQDRPPRLKEGIECRKSGSVWLVTRAGMTRVYGEASEK